MHSVLEWSEDEWSSIIRTNLTGLWLVTKHVCIQMCRANLKGSIINISSIGGVNRGHLSGGLPYIASKGAVNFSTKVIPRFYFKKVLKYEISLNYSIFFGWALGI